MSRDLIEQTKGKWRGILVHAGISESYLTGKKGPCPICKDGVDRFRFDDKGGSGSYICNQCGAGYGIHLLQRATGLDYARACILIENAAPSVQRLQPASRPSSESVLAKAKALWNEGAGIAETTATALHLRNRGLSLDILPRSIRHHDRVMYLEDGEFHGRLPAMLSLIQAPDGRPCGVHRTYLTADGRKAPVPSPRKIMGTLPDGSAVRLAPAAEAIGIAEGIETALAARQKFGVPVWAALTANNLEKWVPPEGTSHVFVFGDNDRSFTGQAAAFVLAKRLKQQGFTIEVHIPPCLGTDWNDDPMGAR